MRRGFRKQQMGRTKQNHETGTVVLRMLCAEFPRLETGGQRSGYCMCHAAVSIQQEVSVVKRKPRSKEDGRKTEGRKFLVHRCCTGVSAAEANSGNGLATDSGLFTPITNYRHTTTNYEQIESLGNGKWQHYEEEKQGRHKRRKQKSEFRQKIKQMCVCFMSRQAFSLGQHLPATADLITSGSWIVSVFFFYVIEI